MQINLHNVMPIPLADFDHHAESIWGKSVTLKKGEHILLNASSGKGKSTFTFSVAGLRKDYTGTILLDEKDIKKINPESWTTYRQKEISVVFQDLQLFPNLTVGENLLLKNNLTNCYSESELKENLDFLGIGHKWEQKCGLLSMGQQQRVAIIRALVQPFSWIIMDEPFSHLDKENASKCMQLITNRCKEQNAGFVLTTLGETHDYEYTRELKL